LSDSPSASAASHHLVRPISLLRPKPEFNHKLQFAGNEVQTSGLQTEFNDFNLNFPEKFHQKCRQQDFEL